MKLEYIEEMPGVVRLDCKLKGLLTPARCIEEAEKLLHSSNRGNLGYADTQDFCDSLLLAQESMESRIHSVIFSMDGEDIIVTNENIKEVINKIFNKVKVVYGGNKGKNSDAVRDAISEFEERYLK